jgi:tetratricopeptide (TPR) repeat protein
MPARLGSIRERVRRPPAPRYAGGLKSRWRTLLVCIGIAGVILTGYSLYLRSQAPVTPAAADPFSAIEIPARPQFSPGADASPAPADVVALRDELFDVAEQLVRAIPAPDALCLLGTAHHLAANDDVAVQLWQQCLQMDPQFADAHLALGMRLLDRGEFAAAEASLREALRIDPVWNEVPLPLEKALHNQGKFPEAVKVLETFVAAHPGSLEGWHRLGLAYQTVGDHENAMRCHLQALKIKPDFGFAYQGVAAALKKLGRAAEAESYAPKIRELMAEDNRRERALRTNLGHENRLRDRVVRTRLTAARVYMKFNRLAEAEAQWQRVAALDPQEFESRESLCALYSRQQRLTDALRMRTELSKLDPDNSRQLLSLGTLQYKNHQLDEAEATFRRVIDLAPQQAAGYAALAQTQMSPGRDLDEAVQLAHQAVKLAPTAEHYYILAMVESSRGDPSACRAAIEEAIRLDPSEARYREAYARLPAIPPQ